MDVERMIDDIEQLEEMFEAPDIRPLSPSDVSAANRRHDEKLAHSPWFRLWQHFGVCRRLRLRDSNWGKRTANPWVALRPKVLSFGNRLETLKGDRNGQCSIRINNQWRICFEWPGGSPGPSNVEIVDYH